MNPLHLLWIIPLASSFGAVAMAILGFDRFDETEGYEDEG